MAAPLIFVPKITEHAGLEKEQSAENRGAELPSVNTNGMWGQIFITAHLLMRAIRLTYRNVKCNGIQGNC